MRAKIPGAADPARLVPARFARVFHRQRAYEPEYGEAATKQESALERVHRVVTDASHHVPRPFPVEDPSEQWLDGCRADESSHIDETG